LSSSSTQSFPALELRVVSRLSMKVLSLHWSFVSEVVHQGTPYGDPRFFHKYRWNLWQVIRMATLHFLWGKRCASIFKDLPRQRFTVINSIAIQCFAHLIPLWKYCDKINVAGRSHILPPLA
jgi:hypothetical protein